HISLMKLTILIPVFNENKTILKLLEKVENQVNLKKQIIVIDDCSNDNSYDLICNFKFLSDHKILKHKKNFGKGECIRTAKKFVTGDIVLIQDADLEYDPNDYHKLVAPILNKQSNVVYGSRVLNKKRYSNSNFISLSRIFFNHILTIFSNILNKQNLTDAHTCYKVSSAKIFNSISLEEKDFAFCPEFTCKIAKIGEKIVEVPVSYAGRSHLEGKKIKTKDGFRAIYTLIKYRFFN
ncbi:glycosyltransferase family 2 protein, partial [Candidatus Pelagibacter sp. HIMB1521]|uniref:glycosyltransferase family 2 protein n=1 Tax=Candidatus Pelagibacter sp. HIMB1521 TaxID=3413344 RepID=UPI003F859C97